MKRLLSAVKFAKDAYNPTSLRYMPTPTSQESTTSLKTFPLVPSQELKRLGIFKDFSDASLAFLQGKVRRAQIPQGESIVDLAQSELGFRYFFFIVQGQVKAVGLDEDARLKPLNFLRKGDFFVDKSFSWRAQVVTKMVAMTDAELLIVPRDDLKALAKAQPSLHEKIQSISEKIDYRNRIYSEDKHARSVLEFLIENELTQASRIKITQLDKCIECDVCYHACENRHGFQRLERGFARFGVLDIAKSCLTCFYPTCIPACPVDAMLFNLQRGEVEVLDSCIGCAACERACQYGAIKMYKVDPADARFSRFLAPNKKIKPKFVADKCNHCHGYEDLACISNCPTDAIIEVEAGDLLENPRIFGTGQKAKPLPSLTQVSKIDTALQNFYIALGLFVALLLTFESYAMNKAQNFSFLLWAQSQGWIPANFKLVFEAGSDYCNALGNIGFTLIFIGMSYPLRKGVPRLFKYLGKQPTWLDLHNFTGLMGTLFITYHTAFHFPFQPSTFGFFALVIVMLSGIFGRFLYAMVPRSVAGTELKMRDIQDEDAAFTSKLDALLGGSGEHNEFLSRLLQETSLKTDEKPSMINFLKLYLRGWKVMFSLRWHFPKQLPLEKRQTNAFTQLLRDQIRLRRKVAFLSLSSRFLMIWRYIHRPVAYIMTLIAFGHIIYNLVLNPKL